MPAEQLLGSEKRKDQTLQLSSNEQAAHRYQTIAEPFFEPNHACIGASGPRVILFSTNRVVLLVNTVIHLINLVFDVYRPSCYYW